MMKTMPLTEFKGVVKIGDLLEIKPGMLLTEPRGPVLVLEEITPGYSWDVMFTTTGYITTVDRLDIGEVVSETDM